MSDPPAPIDASAVIAALAERWSRVQVVAQTESTNADLLADTGAPDRAVLVAELQTAGRGRLERSWTSPAGHGLTFSVLLRPDVPMLLWSWLPLLTGVALHEAVSAHTAVSCELKWPNDLMAAPESGGGKLAGILAQSSGEVIVLGIGLNVTTPAADLPVDTATSLAQCGGHNLDRTRLLTAILIRLDARIAQWSDVGGDAEACGLAAAYTAACATLGQPVAVLTGGATLHGQAVDVDEAGRLVIDTDAGRRAVAAGDVTHVRPGPPQAWARGGPSR